MDHERQLQVRARWLGWLGLLPLVAAAILLALGVTDLRVIEGVRNYAAIILTFVGAIHWGRALELGHAGLAGLSVWPSLYAWACLFLPAEPGLPLLAFAFLLLLLIDQRQYRATAWFRRLRIQLSLSVSGLLLVSWAIT